MFIHVYGQGYITINLFCSSSPIQCNPNGNSFITFLFIIEGSTKFYILVLAQVYIYKVLD